VPHTRQAEVSAISTNTVIQEKVTAINADLDAIAEKGYDSVTRYS
jgi:hypothetical protein